MKCAIILLALAAAYAVPVEDEALQEFVAGNHRFSARVYKEILKEQKGNFIVSPFSAETVLALTNEGAKGDTASEFITGLSLPSTKEKIQQAFKSFLPKLKTSEDDLKLLSANKIYVGEDVKLNEDFQSVAKNVYDSAVDNINFVKNVEAAATINNWVEEHTNRKIQDLIKSDTIDGDTKVVLVNALYFSGQWENQFEDYLTSKKKFYRTKDDAVEVDTMHQVEYLNYYENKNLNAKFLELSYKGADISMVIVLPNEQEGLARLEENVEQLLAPQPFTRERVDVDLPRFTIETEIKFIPILKQLGIKKAFDANLADLTGISSNYKGGLYISDVVQKAFINVTETGTEAAAATAVIASKRSGHLQPFDPTIFHADHPFLYIIKFKDVILFAGRFAN